MDGKCSTPFRFALDQYRATTNFYSFWNSSHTRTSFKYQLTKSLFQLRFREKKIFLLCFFHEDCHKYIRLFTLFYSTIFITTFLVCMCKQIQSFLLSTKLVAKKSFKILYKKRGVLTSQRRVRNCLQQFL